MYRRYLEDQIRKDLEKKMVFVPGPRQVGKTTLAKAPATAPIESVSPPKHIVHSPAIAPAFIIKLY